MIYYRLANDSDNQQLIELTSASGMAGETSLRIDRKPDFFRLLQMRGETKVFIALDGSNIIGSVCSTLQKVYVGGQIFPIQYIGDFKVAESFRNKGIGLQLCNNMADYVISIDADLAFLNVSKGNTKPFSFFKGRPGIPDFENIGIFKIHQFIGKKRKTLHAHYKIELSPVTDELVKYLDGKYSTYEMGPVITKEKLEGNQNYIIRDRTGIIAAACLTDTMNIKQNVVTKLSKKMTYLLKLLNSLSWILGSSKMPLINEPVRMMYIKYLAVNGHDQQLVKLLINYSRNIVYEKSYSFVSLGLHEKDQLNKCLTGLFKLTFNSIGMLLSIKNNKSLIEKVKQGVPFEDYSLV